MSQMIVQGRCISNKYALNVRLIWIFLHQNLSWGAAPLLLHFDSNFCTFYLLFNCCMQVEKSRKVQALINVQVWQFPSILINVQAQIRPCRVTKGSQKELSCICIYQGHESNFLGLAKVQKNLVWVSIFCWCTLSNKKGDLNKLVG